MRQVPIRDLQPLPTAAHAAPRTGLRQLTDAELLAAVRNPRNGDPLVVNTRTGWLHDGNGRPHELLRLATDPNSTIMPDMTVPVEEYTPDLSMFPDLD